MNEVNIADGMLVLSRDGVILGEVFSCNVGYFSIRRGRFFPEDYLVMPEEIHSIKRGIVMLTRRVQEFLSDDLE